MAETIESFVATLQERGVNAGRQEAEKLVSSARQQSDDIVAEAKTKAKKIVESAEAEAKDVLARSRTDLQLAARDTILGLREALSKAVRAVLTVGAKEKLSDADFLSGLLQQIVMEYAKAECQTHREFKINVSHEMQQKLTHWALGCVQDKKEHENISVDLTGTLSEAGFEYTVDGANVEVTLASVADVLSELVNPNLRAILEEAMAEDKR